MKDIDSQTKQEKKQSVRHRDTDTEQQRKKGQKDKEWEKESVRETNIKIVKEDDSERERVGEWVRG